VLRQSFQVPSESPLFRSIFDDLSACGKFTPLPVTLTGLPCVAHRHKQGTNKKVTMSGFKEPSFTDRQKAAQEARKNILNKFRSQPGPDDPAVKARQAERAKAKLARDAAEAERKRVEEETAAAAAAQLLREKEEALERQAALEAEQKKERDARYAARKNKKK
jgi:hypothetical protein